MEEKEKQQEEEEGARGGKDGHHFRPNKARLSSLLGDGGWLEGSCLPRR